MIFRDAKVRAQRRGFCRVGLAAFCGLFARPTLAAVSQDRQAVAPPAARSFRIGLRVVTGVDAQGRSYVESEQPLVNATARSDAPKSTDFWVVRRLPTSLVGALEPTADWRGGNQTPAGGAIGRLLTWPSGFTYPRHTTPSLDFIIVMSGQLELVLDKESRFLNPGDVVIQRGTAHSWRVPGPEPCTFAGVMLDAQPRA